MALELLNKIRAAEAETEEKRSEAQREGRDIVKGVEEACRESERSAQSRLYELYQRGIAGIRQAAESEIAALVPGREKELEQMTKAAEAKIPAAVKLIVERIVNNGNR